MNSSASPVLTIGNRCFAASRFPLVMGVLNVTPDSFSDGGAFDSTAEAADVGLAMFAERANILDIGPESTRPGAQPVDPQEQIRRAVPVIESLRSLRSDVMLSIDTCSAAVARASIAAGAVMVNDTSALRDDPQMSEVVAASGATIVLMHRRGTPADMQAGGGPQYTDLIGEITEFLAGRANFAIQHGIPRDRIVLDPGIGFGKRTAHNVEIMRRLGEFTSLGYPLLIGASRKRFIGEITGVQSPLDRLAGSLACAWIAAEAGAAIIRVHDVLATSQMLRLWHEIRYRQ